MKKLFLYSFLFLTFNNSFCQVNEYLASNGITYHIGDTILLGRGSAPNGDFVYLEMGGLASTINALDGGDQEFNIIPKSYSGSGVTLKKIKTVKNKGIERVYFVVGGGNISNYWLWIEDAISTGEIKSFGMTSDEALSELKKAKDKLDLELINQAQYDSIKNALVKYIK